MSAKKSFKTSIGGQAVIEGIAMKGPEKTCLAVRDPNGEIVCELHETKKSAVRKIPLVRGFVGMIASIADGMKYINRSADIAFAGEEQKTPFEQKLEKRFGSGFMNFVSGLASVLGMVLAVLLFVMLPTALTGLVDKLVALGGWKTVVEAVIKIAIFIGYLFAVTRIKDIHRVFEYHGAEHKTITCFEKGLELTPENARGCSRFHPRCGTSFLFIVIIISIIVFSFVPWDAITLGTVVIKPVIVRTVLKLLCLPVVMGIAYEIIKLAGRYDNIVTRVVSAPGLWVQRLTTFEPDDSQLEVAIASLKAVLPENTEECRW